MEQEGSTLPSISTLSLAITNGLERLCTLIKDSNHQNYFPSADRESARFRIWANNIGAFHRAYMPTSLDHRLRGAKELRLAVVRQLNHLQDLIERTSAIVAGDVQNRVTYDFDEFGTPYGPPITELLKLLTNTKFSVGHLLRLSILIRRRRPRGRLPELDTLNLDPGLDIRHVKDKFPKTMQSAWLAERLGICMARRREIIQYRQLHSDRLGKRHDDEDAYSIMENPASTKATTYEDILDPNSLDSKRLSMKPSFRTTTTTFSAFGTNETGGLSVPVLTDIKFNGVELEFDEEFECPYCRTIQVMETQNDWIHHVLSDLTPYVCTFEKCSMDMYATRHEWFDHEMENHRKIWRCIQCPGKLHTSQAQMKEHIVTKHPGDFTLGQLPFLLETCGEHPDRFGENSCSLCDSWGGEPEGDYRAVSFRRHLGLHLQELALSSLPPYIEGLEICDGEYAGKGEIDTAEEVTAPISGLSDHLSPIAEQIIPPNDSPPDSPRSSQGFNVLWIAASLFDFYISTSKTEAGYEYLTYQSGELFDVLAEKGELWLAKNQNDPNDQVGWIWSKHFAKLANP
ncbi:hypothetical protein F5Y10DRAFT_83158 [Nemania abortiva]|nr:hypothetical protein F5Y10DRAFT_83158 [Nemania abortiva]